MSLRIRIIKDENVVNPFVKSAMRDEFEDL